MIRVANPAFFFSSRRRHTRCGRDWSSDVCSSDLAFVLRGATPVFVDIRSDTCNLDESLIEAAITPRTRAIVPVHYAGVSCDMDAIMALADKYGLLVIEDRSEERRVGKECRCRWSP